MTKNRVVINLVLASLLFFLFSIEWNFKSLEKLISVNPAGVVKKCHVPEIRAVIFYLNWAFAFARQTVTRACSLFQSIQAGNYLFKVSNRSTRTRCEVCSKLTIKIPEQRHSCRFGIFIVKFEHILHIVLVFLLLTLSK